MPFSDMSHLHLSPIVSKEDFECLSTPVLFSHPVWTSPDNITPPHDPMLDANTSHVSPSPSQLHLRYNRLQLNFGVGKCTRTSRPTTFGEIGRRRVSPRENKGKKPKNN